MEEMNKSLLYLAIVAVVVAVISSGFVFYSFLNLATKISGYAVDTGTVNLTVISLANINFTTATINWGSGTVDIGQSFATLNTFETNNVTNGNWTLQTKGGLRIENIGNVNVTLNITVGKNASNFIGGTNPNYEINITDVEAGSCVNDTFNKGIFYNANTSNKLMNCNPFLYENSKDLIRIDVQLQVPYNSKTGALSDTITATASAI